MVQASQEHPFLRRKYHIGRTIMIPVPQLNYHGRENCGLNEGRQARHKAKRAAQFKKLSTGDWTKEQGNTFKHLKSALLNSVVLAHPDFGCPFILSMDASLDGLGVLSGSRR